MEQQIPISVKAGIQPSTDRTALSTEHYTDCDRIRFVDGLPETIGGWDSYTFDNSLTISGSTRSIYSQIIGTSTWAVLGTHQRLYG